MINALFKAILIIIFIFSINNVIIELNHQNVTEEYQTTWSDTFNSLPFIIPTLKLCFGTPNQCFNVAPAITTGYTMIENTAAYIKHFAHSFNITHSSSLQNQYHTVKFNTLNTFIAGSILKDIITLLQLPPLSKFNFVLIDSIKLDIRLPFDGFIGLQKFYDDESIFSDPQSSFTSHLGVNNITSKRNFALNYGEKRSFIEFGETYDDYEKCKTLKNDYEHKKWDCLVKEVIMGEHRMKIDMNVAVFDSLTKVITAPKGISDMIFQDIIMKEHYELCMLMTYSERIVLQCNEKLQIYKIPDLHLILGNNVNLIISWKDLFVLTEINSKRMYVSTFVVETFSKYDWKIGLPGFIGKTIVFDRDDLSVGVIYKTEIPIPIPNDDLNEKEMFVLLSIMTIIILLGICFNLLVKLKLLRI